MFTHDDLRDLQTRSLKMQGWIREQTFSPESEKILRRFSSWEVSELILGMNQSTFRGRLAADPTFPAGKVEPDGRQRWFSLEEVNTLRRKLKVKGKNSQLPEREEHRLVHLIPAKPARLRYTQNMFAVWYAMESPTRRRPTRASFVR